MTAPSQFRRSVREGVHRGPTAGQCEGFVQVNLMILPQQYAVDFHWFCRLNDRACPLLAVGEPGSWKLPALGEDIDVRVDLPKYSVYRAGEPVQSCTDLNSVWRDDLVVFAIGCSFSFDFLLLSNNVPIRHIELNGSAPVFITNIPNVRSGPFAGNLAVSMRPLGPADAIRAIEITSRYPKVHGGPVHFGDPEAIGIEDIARPDFPGVSDLREREVPIFWPCGLTPQVAVMDAGLPFAIGHAAGHMLVTDIRLSDLMTEVQNP
ncbi:MULTISPECIES: putative hydro-lyase [Paraburkholderia]|uniref:putative hydro-lyase n=1 Tax=Paraburkholderia TaxID=1822464 RepID=UPI0006B434D2|nr:MULTISPECIES: putative hydro-lyase [Paraburkholderia]KPD15752.1 hypothetical protein ADM96_30555 [Burkholderia sp. ST111]MBK5153493.1 putative hydro-lyase [Burkholderia sp. R-69608]MBK5185580.1 putative hydro-lyase [Burkholderia sp. R-69749]CAE6881133.1 Putative hydro-lyase [Paraburkholderia domus]CAE6972317.1 Putative hydro-lyase [Paraburkholderia nemoris]